MTLSAVPIAMAAVLAAGWALPLAWWSVVLSASLLTAAMILVISPGRSVGWQTILRRSTTHAAACVWGINALAIVYAVRALNGDGGDRLTRVGYPLLVAMGMPLPGGGPLLMLVILVSLVPIVFQKTSSRDLS